MKIRSQAGLNYTDIGDETFSMPSYRPNQDQGKAARSNSHAYNLSITNTAEYRFNLNHVHDFNFLIGQEGIDYQSEGFSVATAGQNNDKLADIATGTRATSWETVVRPILTFRSSAAANITMTTATTQTSLCAPTVHRASVSKAGGLPSGQWV